MTVKYHANNVENEVEAISDCDNRVKPKKCLLGFSASPLAIFRTCSQVHIHGQWMLPSLMRSFVGHSSIRELCPPANLIYESRGKKTEKGEVLHLSRCYTHTRPYTKKLLDTDTFTQKPLHGEAFTNRSFYSEKLLQTEAFTHRSFYTNGRFYTQKLFHRQAFARRNFAHERFYTQKLSHREAFAQTSFYSQVFVSQSSVYAEQLLHTEALTQRGSERPLHREAFTHRNFTNRHLYTHRCLYTEHRSFCTQTPLHKAAFIHKRFYTSHRGLYTQKLLRTEAFAQKLEKLLHREASAQSMFFYAVTFTHKLLHTDAITHSFCTQMPLRIEACS